MVFNYWIASGSKFQNRLPILITLLENVHKKMRLFFGAASFLFG
jgi:hypothetical protein